MFAAVISTFLSYLALTIKINFFLSLSSGGTSVWKVMLSLLAWIAKMNVPRDKNSLKEFLYKLDDRYSKSRLRDLTWYRR